MKKRFPIYRAASVLVATLLVCSGAVAQSTSSSPTSTSTKKASTGSDQAQSFESALGQGTGAVLSVSEKGTTVNVAASQSRGIKGINFWQAGLSGTVDTNGQAKTYSTRDSDAPAFKAKLGFGHSSFIRNWKTYNRTSAEFSTQALCLDEVTLVDASLPKAGRLKPDFKDASGSPCADAVNRERAALSKNPPLDAHGKPDKAKHDQDAQVLDDLSHLAELYAAAPNGTDLLVAKENDCQRWAPDFQEKCYVSPEDNEGFYPALGKGIVREPPTGFQWKTWASWAPVLVSTPYRPVVGGVAQLSSKQNWSQLLNTGLGEIALYSGRYALGMEGGYGETVQIKQQNVCLNTTSGSYLAQDCSNAMVGKPNPKNSWLTSATLQAVSLPVFGKGGSLAAGAQVQFTYTAPTTGSHSSEIGVPFFISPKSDRYSFVVGFQPTWDRNTDPTIGNKFSITVFAGARPSLMRQ